MVTIGELIILAVILTALVLPLVGLRLMTKCRHTCARANAEFERLGMSTRCRCV
jgi:hypothetical protein